MEYIKTTGRLRKRAARQKSCGTKQGKKHRPKRKRKRK